MPYREFAISAIRSREILFVPVSRSRRRLSLSLSASFVLVFSWGLSRGGQRLTTDFFFYASDAVQRKLASFKRGLRCLPYASRDSNGVDAYFISRGSRSNAWNE